MFGWGCFPLLNIGVFVEMIAVGENVVQCIEQKVHKIVQRIEQKSPETVQHTEQK